jgi:hypothetical protein
MLKHVISLQVNNSATREHVFKALLILMNLIKPIY